MKHIKTSTARRRFIYKTLSIKRLLVHILPKWLLLLSAAYQPWIRNSLLPLKTKIFGRMCLIIIDTISVEHLFTLLWQHTQQRLRLNNESDRIGTIGWAELIGWSTDLADLADEIRFLSKRLNCKRSTIIVSLGIKHSIVTYPAGKQYWANVGAILCTILGQCWQRYTTTILTNIVDQYWANVGHKYWTDIGKTRCTILAQHWAQYCSNIGIATQRIYWPMLGKNCHDIGSYTLRLSANIEEQYRAGLDHIGNNTRPNISY